MGQLVSRSVGRVVGLAALGGFEPGVSALRHLPSGPVWLEAVGSCSGRPSPLSCWGHRLCLRGTHRRRTLAGPNVPRALDADSLGIMSSRFGSSGGGATDRVSTSRMLSPGPTAPGDAPGQLGDPRVQAHRGTVQVLRG